MSTPSHVMWLTDCPANDVNFKGYLKTASADTIRKALEILNYRQEKKTAIKRLTQRLKQLEKEAATA